MHRLLILVLVVGAPGPFQDKPGKVILKKTKDVVREWALYLPTGYNARTPMPFVLSSHGLNGFGKGEIEQWRALADQYKFIVACPDYSAASGRPGTLDDDEKVTLEIYKTVTESFAVDKRSVLITGFSGGGMPTYHDGTRHPDKFTFWCPRSANFYSHVPADEEQLKKCVNIPVYIFYGSKDHELILDQAPKAYELLKKNGFRHLKYEKIEGMGHESRAELAAKWFVDEIEQSRKREAIAAPALKAIAAGEKALEKGKVAEAVKEFLKASNHLRKNNLPDDAGPRIRDLADAALQKVEGLAKEEALKSLEEAKKVFAGTAEVKRIEEKIAELQK